MYQPTTTPVHDHLCRPACAPPPLAATAAAQALRAAFPDYQVTLAARPGGWRFEVTRIRGEGGPWCLVSGSPREIYDALTVSRDI